MAKNEGQIARDDREKEYKVWNEVGNCFLYIHKSDEITLGNETAKL